MSAHLAALALAAQVVTLKAADLPDKPVYVRIGVGVESRLTMPDGLVRLHGYRATADLLGVKLGQARPQALVLLHPRAAGVGRLKYVGQKHTVWFVVEASILGGAQDVEFRVGEGEVKAEVKAEREHAEPSAPVRPAPTPSSSPAPRPSVTTKKTAAPASDIGGVPTPRPPRGTKARTARARSSTPSLDGAPTPTPPRPHVDIATTEAEPEEQREPTAAATPSAAPAESTPGEQAQPAAATAVEARTAPLTPPAVTARRMRRVGRPGQSGIVFEELRHADDRRTLRIRIERAAGTEVVGLDVGGALIAARVEQVGRDLIVVSSIPSATQARRAALFVNEREGGRSATFRLFNGGTR